MTHRNIGVVEQVYAAFERRDIAGVLEYLAHDAEAHQSSEVPWGGEYHGHEGFLHFFGQLTGHVTSKVVVERYIDAGNHVVALGRTLGKSNHTGKHFDVPIAHVWLIEHGKVKRFNPYIDNPTMLAALHES